MGRASLLRRFVNAWLALELERAGHGHCLWCCVELSRSCFLLFQRGLNVGSSFWVEERLCLVRVLWLTLILILLTLVDVDRGKFFDGLQREVR